jgi:hypothetical protein
MGLSVLWSVGQPGSVYCLVVGATTASRHFPMQYKSKFELSIFIHLSTILLVHAKTEQLHSCGERASAFESVLPTCLVIECLVAEEVWLPQLSLFRLT